MRKIYLFLLLALLAMPASAAVRYVNADRSDNAGDGLTWATAHKYLQTALSAATDGDQIWVAKGTYKPTSSTTDRTASFVMKEGVAIYGGFTSGQMNILDRNIDPASNGTVLSGDIDGDGSSNGNSLHVIKNDRNYLTTRAVLDGFTVTHGNADRTDIDNASGAGIYNYSSNPLIIRCHITSNYSLGSGGGIFNQYSSPHIIDCHFSGNQTNYTGSGKGGALYFFGGNPVITNSLFIYNLAGASGGAIDMESTGTGTEISGCQFIDNRSLQNGAGINKNRGDLLLKKCLFQGNRVDFSQNSAGGGAVTNVGSVQIDECRFIRNEARIGGALTLIEIPSDGGIRLDNCSFYFNSAQASGGAIFTTGSPLFQNCLFQENSSSYGGAVHNNGGTSYNDSSIPKFVNCSFNKNSANLSFDNSTRGGGVLFSGGVGSPQFINCVLWDNGGANTFDYEAVLGVGATITYTVLDASVTGYSSGYGGITYIKVDQSPFALGPTRLRPGSPAIDAGLNSANSTITDLAGNQRIINGTIDMGAYEFGSTTGDFAIVGVNGVNCQTLSSTARQLTFTPSYQGSDGSPIMFGIHNEMPMTQAPGPYSLRLYTDNPTITLTAKQGDGEEVRYQYDWLAACLSVPKALAIVGVSGADCQTLSPTARKLSFTPVYEGGDGSPITFSVYGEMVETQAPGPYGLRMYIDNPSISLIARQGNEQSRFQYDWLSVCNDAAARLGVVEEPGSELQLTLLGNPVNDGFVKVEVRGALGQPLAMQLMDMTGRVINEHHVKQAEAVENHAFVVGQQPAGILLLRVSKPTQSQTVKVLNVH